MALNPLQTEFLHNLVGMMCFEKTRAMLLPGFDDQAAKSQLAAASVGANLVCAGVVANEDEIWDIIRTEMGFWMSEENMPALMTDQHARSQFITDNTAAFFQSLEEDHNV